MVARRETPAQVHYAFWINSVQHFEFYHDKSLAHAEDIYMIACDFQLKVFAFNWSSLMDHHHTVRVVNSNLWQDITDAIEPSVAFSCDGLDVAVPVFVSGSYCIAVYAMEDILDNEYSFLVNRREIYPPEQLSNLFIGELFIMAFSPDGATLAVAASGTILLIDMISRTFVGSTPASQPFDILALHYSPDSRVLVAAGNDLNSNYLVRFDGFVRFFNNDGTSLWQLASDDTGDRLPGFDTLASSCACAKMACFDRHE